MQIEQAAEINKHLKRELSGDVYSDLFTRGRYATDASIYQIMPAGVVVPKSLEDIKLALQIAREFKVPVTPRGGGTSQCGQTVNSGLILDNSCYFNQLIELDVANRCCIVPVSYTHLTLPTIYSV